MEFQEYNSGSNIRDIKTYPLAIFGDCVASNLHTSKSSASTTHFNTSNTGSIEVYTKWIPVIYLDSCSKLGTTYSLYSTDSNWSLVGTIGSYQGSGNTSSLTKITQRHKALPKQSLTLYQNNASGWTLYGGYPRRKSYTSINPGNWPYFPSPASRDNYDGLNLVANNGTISRTTNVWYIPYVLAPERSLSSMSISVEEVIHESDSWSGSITGTLSYDFDMRKYRIHVGCDGNIKFGDQTKVAIAAINSASRDLGSSPLQKYASTILDYNTNPWIDSNRNTKWTYNPALVPTDASVTIANCEVKPNNKTNGVDYSLILYVPPLTSSPGNQEFTISFSDGYSSEAPMKISADISPALPSFDFDVKFDSGSKPMLSGTKDGKRQIALPRFYLSHNNYSSVNNRMPTEFGIECYYRLVPTNNTSSSYSGGSMKYTVGSYNNCYGLVRYGSTWEKTSQNISKTGGILEIGNSGSSEVPNDAINGLVSDSTVTNKYYVQLIGRAYAYFPNGVGNNTRIRYVYGVEKLIASTQSGTIDITSYETNSYESWDKYPFYPVSLGGIMYMGYNRNDTTAERYRSATQLLNSGKSYMRVFAHDITFKVKDKFNGKEISSVTIQTNSIGFAHQTAISTSSALGYMTYSTMLMNKTAPSNDLEVSPMSNLTPGSTFTVKYSRATDELKPNSIAFTDPNDSNITKRISSYKGKNAGDTLDSVIVQRDKSLISNLANISITYK